MNAPNELSFLPEDYLEQKYARRANVLCVILFLMAGGAMFAVWHWIRGSNAKVEASFSEVDTRYVDAARKIEQVKQLHEKQREVVHHAELAASLVEKVPRSNILAEITNSLPTGVWLLDFSMHSSVRQDQSVANSSFAQHKAALEKDAAGPQPLQMDVKVAITGIARDDVQVAQLMTHLGHSPLFTAVNLVISDVYQEQQPDQRPKNEKPAPLRRWQIEMMVNPQAEVRADKTAAVELSK